jgi:hypothetical protein
LTAKLHENTDIFKRRERKTVFQIVAMTERQITINITLRTEHGGQTLGERLLQPPDRRQQ